MIGQTVDQYKVLKSLGRNPVAETFLAEHVGTGEKYTLKLITPQLLVMPGFKENLIQDASRLIELDNPRVLPLENVLDNNGRLFLVQRFLEGQSLALAIRANQGSPFPLPHFRELMGDVINALIYLQEQDLFPRFLNPRKVVITEDSRAVLREYGTLLPKTLETYRKKQNLIPSARFFAPERFTNPDSRDTRGLIYSLGIIMFQATTGKIPFGGKTYEELMKRHQEGRIPSPVKVNPEVPPDLSEAVIRAMAKDPGQRYQTFEELRDALGIAPGNPETSMADPGLAMGHDAFEMGFPSEPDESISLDVGEHTLNEAASIDLSDSPKDEFAFDAGGDEFSFDTEADTDSGTPEFGAPTAASDAFDSPALNEDPLSMGKGGNFDFSPPPEEKDPFDFDQPSDGSNFDFGTPAESESDLDFGGSSASDDLDFGNTSGGEDFDFGDPSPQANAPASDDFDFGGDSSPTDTPADDFDFGSPAPASDDWSDTASDADDFNLDEPAPSGGDFDFGSGPPAPESADFDFGETPAPSASGGDFEFGEEPSPSGGDFDFGGGSSAGGDDFDFGSSAPAGDDPFDMNDAPAQSGGDFDFGSESPTSGGGDFDFGGSSDGDGFDFGGGGGSGGGDFDFGGDQAEAGSSAGTGESPDFTLGELNNHDPSALEAAFERELNETDDEDDPFAALAGTGSGTGDQGDFDFGGDMDATNPDDGFNFDDQGSNDDNFGFGEPSNEPAQPTSSGGGFDFDGGGSGDFDFGGSSDGEGFDFAPESDADDFGFESESDKDDVFDFADDSPNDGLGFGESDDDTNPHAVAADAPGNDPMDQSLTTDDGAFSFESMGEEPAEADDPPPLPQDVPPLPADEAIQAGAGAKALKDSLDAADEEVSKPPKVAKAKTKVVRKFDMRIIGVTAALALVLVAGIGYWFMSSQQKKKEEAIMSGIQRQVTAQQYDTALASIAKALKNDPSGDLKNRLLQLRESVEQERDEAINQIATLVTRAKRFEEEDNLLTNGTDDAYGTYLKILGKDPNHSEAKEAVERIKQEKLSEVDSLLEAGDDLKGLSMLSAMNAANKGDKDISSRYSELKKRLAEEKSEEIQQKLEALYTQGRYAEMVVPLNELEQISPGTKFVKDMRNNLIEAFETEAQESASRRRFDAAEAAYENALTLDPDNKKLDAALAEVREQKLLNEIQLRQRELATAISRKDLKKQFQLANELTKLDPGNHSANTALDSVEKAIAEKLKQADVEREKGQFKTAASLYKEIYDINGDQDILALWDKYQKWAPPVGMSFLPVGSFTMGSRQEDDTRPEHQVTISNIFMDKYEVSNRQYKEFVDANPQWGPTRISPEYHDGNYLKHWEGGEPAADDLDRPVTYVSWFAARAYASWKNKRLPTEAEWEKAARGNRAKDKFWWGNYSDANMAVYDLYSEKRPAPVGSFPANPFDVHEILGNVNEWVEDTYDPGFYSRSLKARDPINDAPGAEKVLRGGSYKSRGRELAVYLRFHKDPRFCHATVGFRCVRDAGSDIQ